MKQYTVWLNRNNNDFDWFPNLNSKKLVTTVFNLMNYFVPDYIDAVEVSSMDDNSSVRISEGETKKLIYKNGGCRYEVVVINNMLLLRITDDTSYYGYKFNIPLTNTEYHTMVLKIEDILDNYSKEYLKRVIIDNCAQNDFDSAVQTVAE